jgi:hypothetical protein
VVNATLRFRALNDAPVMVMTYALGKRILRIQPLDASMGSPKSATSR